MLVDLDQLHPEDIQPRSDICIIGAGIAGLILAHRLAEGNRTVTLLEAGGLELEQRSQSLYSAEMPSLKHLGTTEGRFRVFGGSSTRWGGQLLPYTSDIFEPLRGTPSASWPVRADELTPYYPHIEQLMRVNSLPFEEDFLAAIGMKPAGMAPEVSVRFSKWAPFGHRNLGKSLGREVLSHPRIRVVIHANAAAVESNDSKSAAVAVKCVNYRAQHFRFTAGHFVIAAGTIESSRLMLLSNLGNEKDQVGRYFHDHIGLPVARLQGTVRARFLDRLGPFFIKGTLHTCKLEASAGLRARESLLAVMAHVTIQEPDDSGGGAVRNFLQSVQRGRLTEAVGSNLRPMLAGAGDIAHLVYASRFLRRRAVSARAEVCLKIDLEQSSQPANRIRLSQTRDAIGCPKAVVEWHVGEVELDTIRRFAAVIRPRLEAAGFPQPAWFPYLFDSSPLPAPLDTYHAMGGLRMGSARDHSVVTPDLQVHGMDNLSVASCAVYPSGGSSNPTFTLMALAFRLADRILERSK